MLLTIKIFNIFTKQKIGDTLEVDELFDVEKYADMLSDQNPDCNIFIRWNKWGKQNFISLIPKNQKADDIKYQNGEMTWDEYKDKWFIKNNLNTLGLKIEKDK